MLFLILFSFLLIAFFILRHPKSIYAIVYSVEILSICLIILANIIYSLRFCQYTYIYQWEHQIYSFLSRIPVSFFDIRIIINTSLLLFLVSSIFLIILNLNSRNFSKMLPALLIFLLGAFSLLYLNSPYMFEKIYILTYTQNNFLIPVLTSSIYFLNIATLVYIFWPCCKFIHEIITSKIIFKRRHLSLLLILHSVLYSTYLFFLLAMPAKTLFNNFNIYSITKKTLNEKYLLTISVIFFIFILLMIFFNFETLDEKIFHANIKPPKYAQYFSNDIRHLIHNYKNTVLSIKQLSEQAISCYGSDSSLEALKSISSNADFFLKRAHRFLDIYNNVTMEFESIDIAKCLDTACTSVTLPENILLEKHYSQSQLYFYGDCNLMTEVIVNLIANAIESINKSDKPYGKISLYAWSETPWLCIEVIDNGIGIPRKFQKEIFKPLFSTKKSMNNWGIGLSFVKNVIDAHYGYIHLKSKNLQYAQFQVTLPLDVQCMDS